MTAATRGDGIYVGITDDMPGANITVRMGSVRSLIQRIAMRGGALDVDVRPNEGATLTLRLPVVSEQGEHARGVSEPATGAAAPSIPEMERAPQLR